MQQNLIHGEGRLRQVWQKHSFRKEAFEICYHYFEDPVNGIEYTTSSIDELNLCQIKNQYRTKHHIPFPEEIRAIRNQYGLSASKMSEILDFGINSYRLYEQGDIPSLANAKLIRVARNPEHFLPFVAEKKEIFSRNAYEKLRTRIEGLMKEASSETIVDYIWNHHQEANSFTGFVKPKLEKVAHFILFFAERVNPLKTRLNKLLFYADFLHYKRTGFSISGCNYRAIQLGPVPSHFRELFGILESQRFISIEEELFDHGGTGERFYGSSAFNEKLFSPIELAHMHELIDRFEDVRTRQLIEISHQELGWIHNQEHKELIDYQKFAFSLKAL